MIGNEKSRVEDEYQQLTTKHDVMLDCNAVAGCVLVESPEGEMYVLQEFMGPTPYETPQGKGVSDGTYISAQCLPDDSVLVVRTSILDALQDCMGKEHGMKETGTMSLPRPEWYTVDELAEFWNCKRDLIYHYQETGKITFSERFSSTESKGDVFRPLPLGDWSEANKDDLSYQELHDDLCEVLTDGEKQYYIMLEEAERFEKEHGLLVGGVQERITRSKEAQGQKPLAKEPASHNSELLTFSSVHDEPCNPTHYSQEKLPTVLMGPDDYLVHGYEAIGKIANCHKDNVLKLHKKEGLPLYWSASNPYSTFNRLVSWVENRGGSKRETAKNFIKTKNPQEK